jgi:hypothetical protein
MHIQYWCIVVPLPELLLRYPVFFFIIKLNNNYFFWQIVLQDKYNIGVLTVNIECMWLGTKRMEILAKARLSPVSKSRDNTPILYMHEVTVVNL